MDERQGEKVELWNISLFVEKLVRGTEDASLEKSCVSPIDWAFIRAVMDFSERQTNRFVLHKGDDGLFRALDQ
ncbi:MAG: hypothetical protein ACQEV7_21305 [Bacillota bacterium]